jgi:hypothetical protein
METAPALVTITLYKPMEPPIDIPVADFTDDLGYEKTLPVERIAEILGCAPWLVDVLASDEHYVMYSVFDSEEPENPAANAIFLELTTVDVEDDALCGPILVIWLNK